MGLADLYSEGKNSAADATTTTDIFIAGVPVFLLLLWILSGIVLSCLHLL